MVLRTVTLFATVLVAAAAVSSCASVRGWFGGGGSDTAVAYEDSDVVDIEPAEARRALRDVVASHVAQTAADAESARQRVVRKKPFFLKEYSEYPGDATDIMVVELVETESRTAPYRAEVTLPKTRYATQLHRRRDAARDDTNFIRQSGRETLSYSLRSGRWHALGSAFVADRSEAETGGVWRDTPTPPAEAEPEQQRGWFSRQWSRIFGG